MYNIIQSEVPWDLWQMHIWNKAKIDTFVGGEFNLVRTATNGMNIIEWNHGMSVNKVDGHRYVFYVDSIEEDCIPELKELVSEQSAIVLCSSKEIYELFLKYKLYNAKLWNKPTRISKKMEYNPSDLQYKTDDFVMV